MTVKVTLKDGKTVDEFTDEKDVFTEFQNGKLEVHRADGAVKIYAKGSWLTVDGNQKGLDVFLP